MVRTPPPASPQITLHARLYRVHAVPLASRGQAVLRSHWILRVWGRNWEGKGGWAYRRFRAWRGGGGKICKRDAVRLYRCVSFEQASLRSSNAGLNPHSCAERAASADRGEIRSWRGGLRRRGSGRFVLSFHVYTRQFALDPDVAGHVVREYTIEGV